MKILIDIPEQYLKLIHSDSPINLVSMSGFLNFVRNGIVLDELTNGEVIQKMFPDATISFEEEWDSYDNGDICHPYVETFVNVDFGYGEVLGFSLEWWNRKWGE